MLDKIKMARLARAGLLDSLTKVCLPMCELCLARIATTKSFSKAKGASSVLELVNSDIY